MVARDYGNEVARVAAHFGGAISQDALTQALAYAARFPEEIDDWIVESERVARFLADRSG